MLHLFRPILLVYVASLLLACASQPQVRTEPLPAEPVHVTLVAFNDFHGHVQGPSGTVLVDGERVEAGGGAYLAAHIAAIQAQKPHTVVVAAGDLIGASPLVSSIFRDEPTIEVLDMAGLELSSVGNHEFDQGVDELLRIQHGGCHPADEECSEDNQWQGAQFQYLAANVRYRDSDAPIFPAYAVREFAGVKIAFIGLVLENTPHIVAPGGIDSVQFHNEVETINALVPQLQEQGIESIVVLIHEGGVPTRELTDINDCPDLSGPIVDIALGVDEAVDVLISGHTHQPYICNINGKLVTSSQSFGRILTKINLVIDPATRDILSHDARQIVVDHTVEPIEAVASRVEYYVDKSADMANRVVGRITADFPRHSDASGQSMLGTLIADVQLQATAAPNQGNAVIAFMNPGGVRDALHYADPNNSEEGIVTFRQLHTIQPFGNNLITMTLTGKQIHRLLEQQWEGQSRRRPLQVSHGFTYSWSPEKPDGQKVDPSSILLHGAPLEMDKEYRVTVNNFLANGGDNFSVLTEGKDWIGGPNDLDVLVDYFQQHSPLEPFDYKRVTRLEAEGE